MNYILTKILIAALALQLSCVATYAQKGTNDSAWESKPINEWNETDVKNILQNSPWSKLMIEKFSPNTQQLGTIVHDTYTVFTLRSALIVRYAIIRSEQLKAKYDSMDAKAKTAFGQRFKPILDCALCQKFYIISVTGESDLLRQAPRVKSRASNIYLSNEKGERRELVSFSPKTGPGTEALFFFNRYDADGTPLLTPDNQTLTFNFRFEPNDDGIIKTIERVEIKVRDIVRENQVIF